MHPAQTTPPQQSPQARGWTPERRARQSAMMQARKIWLKSTGPKTAAGKARSAANSYKHGHRRAEMRMISAILVRQNRFTRLASLWAATEKENLPNELLKDWDDYLAAEGQNVTENLLHMLKIMQKSCFLGRDTYKS